MTLLFEEMATRWPSVRPDMSSMEGERHLAAETAAEELRLWRSGGVESKQNGGRAFLGLHNLRRTTRYTGACACIWSVRQASLDGHHYSLIVPSSRCNTLCVLSSCSIARLSSSSAVKYRFIEICSTFLRSAVHDCSEAST